MDGTTALNGNDLDAVASTLIEDQNPAPAVEEEVEVDAQPEQAEAYDDEADDVEDVEASDDSDDEDEYAEDAEEEPKAPDLHTVKVNGREVQVTLDELRRGYSGQQYIQQQMATVAESKKEVEAIYHQLQNETQRVAALRQQFESGQFSAPPQPPNDELFKADPIGYMEAKIEYDRQLGRWQTQQQELQQVSQRQAQIQAQAQRAYLQDQMRVLQQAIPEFADPEKAGKLRQRVLETGISAYGYTPEELGQVSDARAVQVLHDAMRYRQMIAARGQAEGRQERPKAGIRPGAKPAPQAGKVKARKQAASRMKQTGSVDDVANFLLS